MQTTLVYLHLTETGEQDARVKLDELAQPGDLFERKFPRSPHSRKQTNQGKPAKRVFRKRKPGKRKPK